MRAWAINCTRARAERGLSARGRKADLIARLAEAIAADDGAVHGVTQQQALRVRVHIIRDNARIENVGKS